MQYSCEFNISICLSTGAFSVLNDEKACICRSFCHKCRLDYSFKQQKTSTEVTEVNKKSHEVVEEYKNITERDTT